MSTSERPVAIRATATSKPTIFGRWKRTFKYDAYFADGRVEQDVNVDEMLNCRGLPADAWATRDAANATCPELGQGKWVEYATGSVLDGPPAN
jgi:hypothetical protein